MSLDSHLRPSILSTGRPARLDLPANLRCRASRAPEPPQAGALGDAGVFGTNWAPAGSADGLMGLTWFRFPFLTLPNTCAALEAATFSGTQPESGCRAWRESGYCSLPEFLSEQPLPFGVLGLMVVLPRRRQGLQRKEFHIPFHVFS